MSFRRLYISGGEKLASCLLCFSPEIHLPEELITHIFSSLGVNPCLLSGVRCFPVFCTCEVFVLRPVSPLVMKSLGELTRASQAGAQAA